MEQKSIEGIVREVQHLSRGISFKLNEDNTTYFMENPPKIFTRTFQSGQSIRGETIYFFSSDQTIEINKLEAYSKDGVSLLRYQRKSDGPISEAHTD